MITGNRPRLAQRSASRTAALAAVRAASPSPRRHRPAARLPRAVGTTATTTATYIPDTSRTRPRARRWGSSCVRIRTSHSSWLAVRCWVVHASGGGAAWCVSDYSVKSGLVRGAIGRSVTPQERKKTAWCFLAPHHRENSHPPTTQTVSSKQRRKPTQNKKKNPKHIQGNRNTKERLTALPCLAAVCVRA